MLKFEQKLQFALRLGYCDDEAIKRNILASASTEVWEM